MTRIFEQAEQRLRDYGAYCRHPDAISNGVRSPFGRIHEMKENAGIYGNGAPTEQFMVDGELIMVRSDGGLGALVSKQQRELRDAIRAKETHDAVRELRTDLQVDLQRLVMVTWVDLPPGKEVQTVRAAAEALSISAVSYQMWRNTVLGIIDAKLHAPGFNCLDEMDVVAQAA